MGKERGKQKDKRKKKTKDILNKPETFWKFMGIIFLSLSGSSVLYIMMGGEPGKEMLVDISTISASIIASFSLLALFKKLQK